MHSPSFSIGCLNSILAQLEREAAAEGDRHSWLSRWLECGVALFTGQHFTRPPAPTTRQRLLGSQRRGSAVARSLWHDISRSTGSSLHVTQKGCTSVNPVESFLSGQQVLVRHQPRLPPNIAGAVSQIDDSNLESSHCRHELGPTATSCHSAHRCLEGWAPGGWRQVVRT
ncbi:hypothetical protein LZ31DRAFT_13765 [Colletotrichum somersetense]|nr:hypothetical protein LZ31DRAFT_13765 [Colletotrichum somersetense]